MSQITNVSSITNPYIYGANADATNTAALYAPAELGAVFYNGGNRYQRVLLDSGATAATPTGIVAVGQTAFWIDKTNKRVTNDKRLALTTGGSASSRNAVAGIFRNAVTAGNYTDILNKGNGVQVASDGGGAVGDIAVSDATAATARVTNVTIGTAPTVMPVGLIRAVAANSLITVDVDIAPVD